MTTIKTLSQLIQLVREYQAQGKVVAIRYSNGPTADAKSGYRSRNYADFGKFEAGLSVNRLDCFVDDLVDFTTAILEYQFTGGQPYILTGELCSCKGGDGEPLLRSATVKPIARVSQAVIGGALEMRRTRSIESLRANIERSVQHSDQTAIERATRIRAYERYLLYPAGLDESTPAEILTACGLS